MADKIKKNFDAPIVDLDGKPHEEFDLDVSGKPIVEGGEIYIDPKTGEKFLTGGKYKMRPTPTINKLIARALNIWEVKEMDDPIELYDWACLFHRGGDIELERKGYEKIKEILKKSYLSVSFQAQVFRILDA